ncbi:MAG: hypothetical protein AAFQ85_07650 [Pseudomonadota bacterium]
MNAKLMSRLSAALLASTCLGFTATAQPDQPYNAMISFALDSERNTIQYRHGDLDTDAAHDQAMLHAARFLISQGKVEFKVEGVRSYSPNWQARDPMRVTLDCGQFVCSERMGSDELEQLYVSVQDGEIVVVVDIVSGRDAQQADALAFNTGQVIYRTQPESQYFAGGSADPVAP